MLVRPTCPRGALGAVATCVGVAAVAATVIASAVVAVVAGGADPLLIVNAGLASAVAVLALVAVRLVRDVREQQRRILDHLEVQTRVLRNAARVAADRRDEAR
ncbi:hypothetical protein [Actinomadura fibrosa]|uniref:Uncharacterized protein n=1 Tax=Actinomadura fibrosa TaxID=111802 RepID=A0ABW2XS70_9ACTN|nr:hypothetical protein [Actinomadura fibrosa]